MKIEQVIAKYEGLIRDNSDTSLDELDRWNLVIDALREKQQRGNIGQWLDDMDNPMEPLKIEAALKSEIMKMHFRREHKPDSISPLDYTIIAVLTEALNRNLEVAGK